jgi:hypothetical protein
MTSSSFHIAIYGLLNSNQYQRAKSCLEDLKRTHANRIFHAELHPLFEYQWNSFLRMKRAELRDETWAFNDPCMIFVDKTLLGNVERNLGQEHIRLDRFSCR